MYDITARYKQVVAPIFHSTKLLMIGDETHEDIHKRIENGATIDEAVKDTDYEIITKDMIESYQYDEDKSDFDKVILYEL